MDSQDRSSSCASRRSSVRKAAKKPSDTVRLGSPPPPVSIIRMGPLRFGAAVHSDAARMRTVPASPAMVEQTLERWSKRPRQLLEEEVAVESPAARLPRRVLLADLTCGAEPVAIPVVMDLPMDLPPRSFASRRGKKAAPDAEVRPPELPRFEYMASACVPPKGDARAPAPLWACLPCEEVRRRMQGCAAGEEARPSLCQAGCLIRSTPLAAEEWAPPALAVEAGKEPRILRAGTARPGALEVFWVSNDVGWGVRARRAIPAEAFVCEYAGDVVTDEEADARCLKEGRSDAYLFELSSPTEWTRLGADPPDEEVRYRDGVPAFLVDASARGNVGRLINHACGTAANLSPVLIFCGEAFRRGESEDCIVDVRLPRVAFFTRRAVAACEELRLDYGMPEGSVLGKTLQCHCGAATCRGRIY